MKLSSYLKSVFSIKNITLFSLTFLTLSYFYFSDYDWKNKILNAVTPITGYLSTNTTSGVTTSGTAVTSLISGGFVQGVNALFNTNANSYIAWAWKEDATSGFDMVSYTGTGANRTVAHDLAATPAFMMVKRTDVTGGNWVVYHQGLTTPATQYLVMNTTAAVATDTTMWNSTLPNSTTFSLGTNTNVNANGGTYIAYTWTEKTGYSKFGTYTGNSSADGPFVYTGFKPKYVMIKVNNSTAQWFSYDGARNTYNEANTYLTPSANGADNWAGASTGLDILSNGFKLRNACASITINCSGQTYVYAAFAETPFKESGTAYNTTIASSTRFNGTNAYVARTPGSAGNTTTLTLSAWTKRSRLTYGDYYDSSFYSAGGGVRFHVFGFTSADKLKFFDYTGSSEECQTAGVFRDPSAWYHIVYKIDRSQATQADRCRIYVNGVEQVLELNTIGLGASPNLNAAKLSCVGCGIDNTGAVWKYYDGYLSDVTVVDGQALTPTSFGEFDTNGIWKPKAYSGTYGTNGFHLDFSDPSNPGNDVGKGGVTISSLAFQPDLVWIKATSSALNHAIFDSVQGVGKYLSSNLTAAVTSLSTTLKSFTSTGFTLGSAAITNTLNAGYVAWNWKESTTSGLDIVSYTGNGANRTIAHNLGVTPGFVMVKRTNASGGWMTYHQSLTSPATQYVRLNSQTSLETTDATVWNSTSPNSTTFALGTHAEVNTNGASYIAYVFAEKSGFSKFGSYDGNSSADGPFVYTGFKPKFILFGPRTGTTFCWFVYDTERQEYNPFGREMCADSSGSEGAPAATRYMDILSNGFKLRASASAVNAAGSSYMYAAFAEEPFKEAGMPYNLTVASSTRFNGTNATLSRTYTSNATWTFSGWVKRSKISSLQSVLGTAIQFNADDTLTAGTLTTTAKFRDPSKWMHVVVSNSGLFIDGVSFGALTTSALTNVSIGGPNFFDGYISDLYLIDGTALPATSFGEYDTNGIWKPKTYIGTYGVNGFHLNFADPADPGNDVSGNGNNFTNNNIATTDNVIDSPTNNFAVGNAVDMGTNMVPSNGNLAITNTVTTNTKGRATVAVSSGKWYFESIPNLQNSAIDGICETTNSKSTTPGNDATSWSLFTHTGNKKNNGSSIAYGSSLTANTDVLMTAFDLDTGKIWWGKNGTWFASGDPASGTNEAFSNIPSNMLVAPCFVHSTTLNFGQGGQSGLSYDPASAGYFKYTPPAGFKALSTGNMPASAVTKSNDYFDVVTYTGTGSGNGFTNNNIAVTDNVIDTPTNNFNTWNPLSGSVTLSNGNLTTGTNGWWNHIGSTQSVNSGKWYFETTGDPYASYFNLGFFVNNPTSQFTSDPATNDYYYVHQMKYHVTEGTYSAVHSPNGYDNVSHTFGIALDLTNHKLHYSMDGAWLGGSDPDTNTGGIVINPADYDKFFTAFVGPNNAAGNPTAVTNFGQGGQAGLTYNAASGGYFKYTPPAGFKALSTSNLPASDITKSNDYFDAQTYTGTGAAATRSLFNFEPALLWIKDRTSANNHGIFSTFSTGVVSASLQMFFEI